MDRRLEAARAVADKGVKVGFHFHPMMYFEGWEEEYRALMARVVATFRADEVLWISLGCVTLLKGFAQDFRLKYKHSKLLQMETETTPDGKITYASAVRERLYRNALEALARDLAAAESAAVSSFIATARCSTSSCARHTRPMPPLPIESASR